MITTCTSCNARYQLDATKVPHRRIRVRCPDCGVVYELDGTAREEPAQAPPVATNAPTIQAMPAAPPSPPKAPAVAAATTEPNVAVADTPRPSRRRRDKSEMLARALVSDILVYNKDARDKALADGSLLKTLGPEIKKSWELYKEKVGADVASSSDHFKNALNEILADGDSVF